MRYQGPRFRGGWYVTIYYLGGFVGSTAPAFCGALGDGRRVWPLRAGSPILHGPLKSWRQEPIIGHRRSHQR